MWEGSSWQAREVRGVLRDQCIVLRTENWHAIRFMKVFFFFFRGHCLTQDHQLRCCLGNTFRSPQEFSFQGRQDAPLCRDSSRNQTGSQKESSEPKQKVLQMTAGV